MGPVMLDIRGLTLAPDEVQWVAHPRVGGVILFSRNFASTEQLKALTAELHAVKDDLIIAVDHEGGRVQRFKSGFTVLPPMAALGEHFNTSPQEALTWAKAAGFVLAWELNLHGVDLSFTPVLDLDFGRSAVIGNRAFHRNADVVAQLAAAHCVGLHQAGFPAVGKHFPGHGFVEADSHHDLPVDPRSFAEIDHEDIEPFRRLMGSGLEAIMPAHIRYVAVDDKPAGFSPFWLQQVLRVQLGFDGVIFSDDLSMKGALGEGGPAQRARAAMTAGCDMVLLCNDPAAAQELVEGLDGFDWNAASAQRLTRMMSLPEPSRAVGQAQYELAQECLRPFLNSLS